MTDWKKYGAIDIQKPEVPSGTNWDKYGAIDVHKRGKGEKRESMDESSETPFLDYGKEAIRQVGRTGRLAATGIAGLADLPNLAAIPLHASGLKETPYFYEPIGGRVQKGIDTLTGGKLKPRNKAEEWIDWLGESAAPLALAPYTGGASLTGTAAKTAAKSISNPLAKKAAEKIALYGSKTYAPTAKNIGSNIGSSAALKNYMDNSENPGLLGMLGAGLIGGKIGGGSGSFAKGLRHPIKNYGHPIEGIKNKFAGAYGASKELDPVKYAQYKELGLSPTLGRVSNSKKTQMKELDLAHSQKGSDIFERHNRQLEGELAQNLGISNPRESVKRIDKGMAKSGAQSYEDRVSNAYETRSRKFEPRVQKAVENREMIDIGDILENLKAKGKGLITPSEVSLFEHKPSGEYLKKLSKMAKEEAEVLGGFLPSNYAKELQKQGYPQHLIEKILSKADHPQKISYPGLDAIREEALNESMRLNRTKGEKRDIKNIYHQLSDKRHKFMEEHGTPSEIHNAKEARKLWAKYKGNMEEYVDKVLDAPSDAAAFQKVFSNDPKFARAVVNGFKSRDDKRRWTESVLSHLGNDNGIFKASKLRTSLKKYDPAVQKEYLASFDKKGKEMFYKTLDLVAEHKEEFDKIYNTSRSAYTGKNLALDEHLKNNLVKASFGDVNAAGRAIVNLIARYPDKASAKLFTDQRFLKRVNDVMTAKNERAMQNHLNHLFKNKMLTKSIKGLSNVTKALGQISPHIKDTKKKEASSH